MRLHSASLAEQQCVYAPDQENTNQDDRRHFRARPVIVAGKRAKRRDGKRAVACDRRVAQSCIDFKPVCPRLGCICSLCSYSSPANRWCKATRACGGLSWRTKIAVHDPRGYPPKVVGKRLAPRLERLDGKVIYLVDCLFENSDVFMEQMRQWFAAHLPAVVHSRHQAARELGRRPRHARDDRARRAGRHSRRRSLKHLLPHGRGVGPGP